MAKIGMLEEPKTFSFVRLWILIASSKTFKCNMKFFIYIYQDLLSRNSLNSSLCSLVSIRVIYLGSRSNLEDDHGNWLDLSRYISELDSNLEAFSYEMWT